MSRFACATVAFGAALMLGGCGTRNVEVKGVVTLDGKPVDGATVVFTSDDGHVASGFTDANGNFSLKSGENSGAPPGIYSATVAKYATMGEVASPSQVAAGGGDPMKDKSYLKAMEKNMKDAGKGAMKGPQKGPPMPAAGGGSGGGKSLLPQNYESPGTTPFKNLKIPADGPIELKMTGPPAAGGPPGKH